MHTQFTVVLLFCMGLMGCNNTIESNIDTAGQNQVVVQQESVQKLWARTCALCHAGGEGGAPRIGVAQEWAPRLSKGKKLLLSHTIEGFNDMPPLGYCMSCSKEEFSALIDFMAGPSR